MIAFFFPMTAFWNEWQNRRDANGIAPGHSPRDSFPGGIR
jgi:hypothetical protein